jgi:hypothetical protein
MDEIALELAPWIEFNELDTFQKTSHDYGKVLHVMLFK